MNWSSSTDEPCAPDAIAGALTPVAALDWQAPEIREAMQEQIIAAQEAARVLAKAVGDGGKVSVSINARANADHGADAVSGPETITVTVQARPESLDADAG